jgi:hypothetical protein
LIPNGIDAFRRRNAPRMVTAHSIEQVVRISITLFCMQENAGTGERLVVASVRHKARKNT